MTDFLTHVEPNNQFPLRDPEQLCIEDDEDQQPRGYSNNENVIEKACFAFIAWTYMYLEALVISSHLPRQRHYSY